MKLSNAIDYLQEFLKGYSDQVNYNNTEFEVRGKNAVVIKPLMQTVFNGNEDSYQECTFFIYCIAKNDFNAVTLAETIMSDIPDDKYIRLRSGLELGYLSNDKYTMYAFSIHLK